MVLCLLALCCAFPLEAQSQPGTDSGNAPSLVSPSATPPAAQKAATIPTAQFIVPSNLVSMPVTVTDRDGNFVYNLTQSDFEVLDNNVPQKITFFDDESHPVAAVILIQTNEQAGPLLSNLTKVGPVISQLLLGTDGQAAVLFFSDRVREVQDFSGSSDTLDKTLKSLKKLRVLGDKARLNDAMARAIALLDQRPHDDRRLIVAISTGSDSGSETSRAEVMRRATAAEVTIYGIRLSPLESMLKKGPQAPPNDPLDIGVERPMPPGMPATPDMSTRLYETPVSGAVPAELGNRLKTIVFKTDLASLARFTGGVYYSQWSLNKLESDLDRVATEVHSQYELAYVPNDLTQTGFHRIQVRVRAKPKQKLNVRTREGYFFFKGEVGKSQRISTKAKP